MHPRAEQFCETARDRYDFDPEVREFPEGTKTAADAAAAIGCDVAQIASSIAVATDDGLAVVVTSGANRVDTDTVAALLDVDRAAMADAGDVKAVLGWSIGGVPPFCHATDVPVLLDETLLEFEEVWAAAGTPEAVFPLAPDELRELSGGRPADVKED
jgi:prolyl-tRNA editing enzyme YbaK/EbsC (Cys-tRNA(Pro) deacylase)